MQNMGNDPHPVPLNFHLYRVQLYMYLVSEFKVHSISWEKATVHRQLLMLLFMCTASHIYIHVLFLMFTVEFLMFTVEFLMFMCPASVFMYTVDVLT